MKSCPACKTQYSDDTLKYCLQDGTPLAGMSENEMPTVVFGETEATVARSRHDRMNVPVGGQTQHIYQQTAPSSFADDKPPRSNTLKVVVATVLGMLLLFGVTAAAAYFMFFRGDKTAANNANLNANVNIPAKSPTPAPPRTPSPTPAPADFDLAKIKSDITNRISTWENDAESLDLDSYMSNYAPKVDYYKKPGASLDDVRSDKQRAFEKFDSINFNISNVEVTVDPSGEVATATFDKEWDFSGDDESRGKVRQEMKFKKIGGKWLITGERDLKVYSKE